MAQPRSTPETIWERLPDLAGALPGWARAAASEAPVLLVGEPGSGRSTLARMLHRVSPRAGRPLVEVDVSVIPSALFEGELFGHRRGAFTGAAEDLEGRVARAAGGALLLDQLEELPLTAQPKLLRLLAERRYAPLGGEELSADVRFIAVASEDLPERVERGVFRRDLFYRLEVLAFRVPPLRERRRDLPALVELLLADLGDRLGRPLELDESAWEWMREHPWPGNVTELRGVLERAAILQGEGPLRPLSPEGADEGRPLPLVEMERREILKALAFTRGHQGRAAQLLGISRKALWEKRKRLGLP